MYAWKTRLWAYTDVVCVGVGATGYGFVVAKDKIVDVTRLVCVRRLVVEKDEIVDVTGGDW